MKFKNGDIVKIIDKNSKYFGRHVQVVGVTYDSAAVPCYIALIGFLKTGQQR